MPLVGNYLQFRQLLKQYKLTHRVWEKLASKYGSLLGLRLGSDRLVIVSGYKMIREVLNKEEFEGRPDGFFFRLHAFGQNILVIYLSIYIFLLQFIITVFFTIIFLQICSISAHLRYFNFML